MSWGHSTPREIDTFNLSSTWKNASLSMNALPVGTYKGGNTRFEVTSSSEPSMGALDRLTSESRVFG